MQAHNYMVRANPCKLTLMHEPVKASEIQLRPVRLWLLMAAAMIFLTLIVGGATRLTESGLCLQTGHGTLLTCEVVDVLGHP